MSYTKYFLEMYDGKCFNYVWYYINSTDTYNEDTAISVSAQCPTGKCLLRQEQFIRCMCLEASRGHNETAQPKEDQHYGDSL